MTSYASKEMNIMGAKAFVDSVNESDGRSTKNSTILYAVLGKSTDWPNEPNASTAVETIKDKHYDLWKNAIGAKKINATDVSHVIPRNDWTTGRVYPMYKQTNINLYTSNFFVLTDQNNVYKCLYNNKGGLSTVKPAGFSTTPFTTSDGYTWKYMYTISLGLANKFLTASHMPVQTLTASDNSTEQNNQLAVQNASVNGAIHVIETNDVGSGYGMLNSTAVVGATSTTIQLAQGNPSSVDNHYNGDSVYIQSGTGLGQLRRIVNYDGASRTLTTNTGFSTTPDTTSTVLISPTVNIIGDGVGALAYSLVNTNGNISNVNVIAVGSKYTHAKAYISSNTVQGTGATANVIISPIGGHGKDPIRELGGNKVCLNAQFKGSQGVSATGAGYIPANTEFRTISVLKDPILKVNSNNAIMTEAIANTSNSADTLRLTTRLNISYQQVINNVAQNQFQIDDEITNERMRLNAENGTIGFITELNAAARQNASVAQASNGANGTIVFIKDDELISDTSFFNIYLNNVDSYGNHVAFTKNDILLKRGSSTKVATVSTISGPEANTYSGEFIHVENFQKVDRAVDQTEDIKVILDF